MWEERQLNAIAKAGDRAARRAALVADLSSNGRQPKLVRVRQLGCARKGTRLHVIQYHSFTESWRTLCGSRNRIPRAPHGVETATCAKCTMLADARPSWTR